MEEVRFGFFAHVAMITIAIVLFLVARNAIRNFLKKARKHDKMIARFVGDGRNGSDVFIYYLEHNGSAIISNKRGMWGYARIKGDRVAFGYRYNGQSGPMSMIRVASMPWREFKETFINVSSRNKAWHAFHMLLKKIEDQTVEAENFENEIYSEGLAMVKIAGFLQ